MKSTLAVAAIEKGTVIDHLQAGFALPIVHYLKLTNYRDRMTLGLNLPSKRHGLKDIIKIEGRLLSEQEVNEIAIFSAGATINFIKKFSIIEKRIVPLPESVKGILSCPNHNCISHEAGVKSLFHVREVRNKVELVCHYCERAVCLHSLSPSCLLGDRVG